MVQHGPIACPLTGPCGLSQCSRWSWYCLTSSERKCLIIKGQRLRSRHQLFEVKHAVSKTWNEDKMRYIQIITKHLPLRRADSQSLPLPPRMTPLCCNVREWDKAWKMWSCLVQRDSWDLRGRIQKRGTTTILWTTTKEKRLTTAQLPLLLVILLSHTVAFLSSRANAILPSSCGHQLYTMLEFKVCEPEYHIRWPHAIAYFTHAFCQQWNILSVDWYRYHPIPPRCHFWWCWA